MTSGPRLHSWGHNPATCPKCTPACRECADDYGLVHITVDGAIHCTACGRRVGPVDNTGVTK